VLLSSLIGLPVIGIVAVSSISFYKEKLYAKFISLAISVANLIISLWIFIFFHNSTNQFQYVQEHYNMQIFDLYLGVDGTSIYFILLTTIIMPIALLSN
jgi:NADH-ubiquinone oxidoreductase chain 4